MTSYEEFFAWCQRQGFRNDREIANAFGMTPQTVRNWKAKVRPGSSTPPVYLSLACLGFEATRPAGGGVAKPPEWGVEWFEAWRHHHNLQTLERTGGAFGLTRQAVHNWFKRKSLPRWLPLACIGYERRTSRLEALS